MKTTKNTSIKSLSKVIDVLTFAGYNRAESDFPTEKSYNLLQEEESSYLQFEVYKNSFEVKIEGNVVSYLFNREQIENFNDFLVNLYKTMQVSGYPINPRYVTVQMILDGDILYLAGEGRLVMKEIVEAGMEKEWKLWRLRDPDSNGSLMDLFDTIVNFPLFYREARLYGSIFHLPSLQFFGMTEEESLKEMYDFCMSIPIDKIDTCKFNIRGIKGMFQYNSYLFHMCFAKGRISVAQLMQMLQSMNNKAA